MKLTTDNVRELLDYDPDTGVLTWRARGSHWFKRERDCVAWNAQHAGVRAGSVFTNAKTGYQCRHLGFAGRRYLEHRVAWMWVTGEHPPENLDHDNRDATDNRWTNIRGSSPAKNALNRSKSPRNSSGAPGVTFHRKTGRWQAQGCCGGKRVYLGLFKDFAEAAKVSAEFREGHGYHPDHGAVPAKYREAMS